MFSLREFVKKGLLDAVGKMADYQVAQNATGWYEKSVLLLEDLEEIDVALTRHAGPNSYFAAKLASPEDSEDGTEEEPEESNKEIEEGAEEGLNTLTSEET